MGGLDEKDLKWFQIRLEIEGRKEESRVRPSSHIFLPYRKDIRILSPRGRKLPTDNLRIKGLILSPKNSIE